MRVFQFILFVTFYFPSLSFGEYRAFELQVTNPANGKTRTVISTLDQYQYPAYYHLASGETIEYMTSWMCYGRTSGHQPICSKPDTLVPPTQNPVKPNTADPALQVPAN